MLKKLLTIILLNLCFLFAHGIDDNQFWHAEKLSLTINEKSKLTLEQDFRAGDQASELYYFHGDFGLSYQITPQLFLGLNFREAFEQKDNIWTNEHRPYGQITGKKKIGSFATAGRIRIEYRIRNNKKVFRNRNKITIKLNKSYTSSGLVPYIADEIFIDLVDYELSRNRAYVGIEITKLVYLRPSLYYMLQSTLKNDNWINYSVIGLKFSF